MRFLRLLSPFCPSSAQSLFSSQKAVAREILALHDFSDASQLIDVGGSNGTFIASAATRYPHLHFTLFDLPAVTEIAQESFEKQGISGRTQIAPGSFLKDPLPQGADIATLIRVLHDHDDAPAMGILRSIRAALHEMPGMRGDDVVTSVRIIGHLQRESQPPSSTAGGAIPLLPPRPGTPHRS